MKRDENPSGCILILFLLLAFAIAVMFIPDAGAQVPASAGTEPVFWYRCDCLTCWYLDLQGNDVPVFWGTWVNNEQLWGIYLDCQGRRYPDCHSCWSIHDARRWER